MATQPVLPVVREKQMEGGREGEGERGREGEREREREGEREETFKESSTPSTMRLAPDSHILGSDTGRPVSSSVRGVFTAFCLALLAR